MFAVRKRISMKTVIDLILVMKEGYFCLQSEQLTNLYQTGVYLKSTVLDRVKCIER